MDLFIVRIAYDDNGEMFYKNSRPCYHCLELLKSSGIRKVHYTIDSQGGEFNFQTEKISQMISTHVSSGNIQMLRKHNIKIKLPKNSSNFSTSSSNIS
jgi:deoxycytidylate deaminase